MARWASSRPRITFGRTCLSFSLGHTCGTRVLQHGAGHSLLHRPITDFRSLEVERKHFKAAPGKHEQGSTAIVPLRPEDRHRRAGDVTRPIPCPPATRPVPLPSPSGRSPESGLASGVVAGHSGNLNTALGWLPDARAFVSRQNLPRRRIVGLGCLAIGCSTEAKCDRRHDKQEARQMTVSKFKDVTR